MSYRQRRLIFRSVAGLLLIFIGLTMLALMWPRESMLLQATRLTDWKLEQEEGRRSNDSYWWLSNHEILFLSGQRGSVDRQDYRAIRYDTRNGSRTHLSAIENELLRHLGNMRPDCWQVSPDGKYLLWNGSDATRGTDPKTGAASDTLKTRWYVTPLNGGPTQTWPRETSEQPIAFWLPDSRRWVEWQYHSASASGQSGMDIHTLGSSAITSSKSDLIAGYYMPIGLTSQDTGVSVSPRVGDGDVTLVQWHLTPGFVPQNGKFLPTSGKTGPLEAVVSPQGDCIAWKFGTTPGPRFMSSTNFMRHLDYSEVGLYVSRLDGSDMRLLGMFNAHPDETIHLRWTPDGKRLSFAHQGGLYTVPVPSSSSNSSQPGI